MLIFQAACFHSTVRPGSLSSEVDYLRYFASFNHDVSENTELIQVYIDLGRLTSVNFSFDQDIHQTIMLVDSTLPQLKGFNVAELVRMIPEIVGPEIEFQYEYGPGRNVRIHLRTQE
jgi:hypothetical protein